MAVASTRRPSSEQLWSCPRQYQRLSATMPHPAAAVRAAVQEKCRVDFWLSCRAYQECAVTARPNDQTINDDTSVSLGTGAGTVRERRHHWSMKGCSVCFHLARSCRLLAAPEDSPGGSVLCGERRGRPRVGPPRRGGCPPSPTKGVRSRCRRCALLRRQFGAGICIERDDSAEVPDSGTPPRLTRCLIVELLMLPCTPDDFVGVDSLIYLDVLLPR